MSIAQSFLLAMKNILSNKARSLLTMLGIIIGVAAVIVIVGLGSGMEQYMKDSFKNMGTNLLNVNVMGRGTTRSISVDDMYALVEENPVYLEAVSPTVTANVIPKIKTESLSSTQTTGVGEDYLDMRRQSILSGRFIGYVDILKREKVCVIGSYIANEYFSGNALSQEIKLNGDVYKVIGVVAETADSTEASGDDVIYIPYSVAAKLSFMGTITGYSFSVVSEDDVTISKQIIEDKLHSVFGSDSAYFVTSMAEMLNEMSSMINVVVTVLAAIAAISLLVGGIGIMNIMLVSVSERTREIGIRKSLGAKRRHVMWQFVTESGTTSAIGGILGIGFGYLLSTLATSVVSGALGENLTVSPGVSSVLFAFFVSVGIGVLFGYLPARKAARLNPIDALRYD